MMYFSFGVISGLLISIFILFVEFYIKSRIVKSIDLNTVRFGKASILESKEDEDKRKEEEFLKKISGKL